MNGIDFKTLRPHLIALGVFIALSAAYFAPELQGKRLLQSDIVNFKGMSKEIKDYRENTGEEPYWTNSMFGGMPAYQISVRHAQPILRSLDTVFKLGVKQGMGTLFLYLIGFYILMVSLKVDPLLGILGSVAYAFSSYFFIILEAGHTSKAYAIGYAPMVIAGFVLLFVHRRYLWGTVITALAFGLQLFSNHPQITYYTGILILCLGIFFLVDAIRQGALNHLAKASLLFIAACAIGFGMNASRYLSTLEYSEFTIRGPSELSEAASDNNTSGLDKDYATAWSYGIGESWTLLVPEFKGGASGAIGNDKSALEAVSRANRQTISRGVDRYWGDQPFTSGPVYAGAVVILLALLGLIMAKGPMRWGLLVATVLGLMLAWGKNFMPLTDFFLENVPAYNKFRAVSMTLVIVELALPILAVLGLHSLLKEEDSSKKLKMLYASAGGLALVLLLMYITPGTFTDFYKTGEEVNLAQQLEGAGYNANQVDRLMTDIVAARSSIFKADVLRSLLLILLGSAVLWTLIKDKLKTRYALIILGVIILADMWSVNRRYLDEDAFQSKRRTENAIQATPADQQILQDPDPYFRVYNTTRRLDQDGITSYYHKSIGGYHGAKLRRYQDLIERQLATGNTEVIDMLNTKYVIQQTQDGQVRAIRNPGALGNAWFVNELIVVEDADAEMVELDSFDASSEAVMDKRFTDRVGNTSWTVDSTATISLEVYEPNFLRFDFQSSTDAFVVFSDIYYQPGWTSTLDGQEKEHVRVNYVLRGMEVPAGEHTIEFSFEPPVIKKGNTINLASTIILVLLLGFGLFKTFRSKEEVPIDS
ncbi:MAG: YfhO family protein [Flavobacteriales bacterium]|nr:YfhO family protein [Flavobacteriales bacterium]